MPTPLEVVNHFYDVTLKGSDGLDELSQLFAENAIFQGPLQTGNGRNEITQINAAFVPFVKGYNVLAQFENGDDVSTIHEIHAQLPNGEDIHMTVSEWFKLRDGLIVEHRIYFDPRKFIDVSSRMQG